MKKTIVASILGIAATFTTVSKSLADGTVFFVNYNSLAATAPVTYRGDPFGGFVDGETIGIGFTAKLLYSYGADLGVTFHDSGITSGFIMPSGTSFAEGGGLFGNLANAVTIPGYTSGHCDFLVQVYQGSDASSSAFFGVSDVVSLSLLATSSNVLPTEGLMADSFRVITPLTAFTVSAPEPSTFALAGLGGAALLLFRRKK